MCFSYYSFQLVSSPSRVLQIELLISELLSEAVAPPGVLLQLLSSLLYRSEAVLAGPCPVVHGAFLRCTAPLIAAAPCQRTVELFFRFLGPYLLPLLSATSERQSAKADSLPGESEHLRAFSEVVFAVIEVLEATSLRSNVPLDLIDNSLDFLEHLLRCPSNAGVREASCCFLRRFLEARRRRKRRGDVMRRVKTRVAPLTAELAARVAKESNEEALAALLHLLTQLMPLTQSCEAGTPTLHLLAELLETSRRQEVLLAALPLVGRLWRYSGSEGELRRRLVGELHRRSAWDQGADVRAACAAAVSDLFAVDERKDRKLREMEDFLKHALSSPYRSLFGPKHRFSVVGRSADSAQRLRTVDTELCRRRGCGVDGEEDGR